MTRLLLVISNLTYGGAERQVVELANQLDRENFEVHVCILSDHAPLANSLADDVSLHRIRKYGRFDVSVVPRLALLMRRLSIDIVHGFLFDAEIASRLAARVGGVRVVIGSERNSAHSYGRVNLAAYRWTSSLVTVCVANSQAGKKYNMEKFGLPEDRYRVVYNGVDTERFQPRGNVAPRVKLACTEHPFVLGMVGSFKRQKNHPYLLHTVSRLLEKRQDFIVAVVGTTIFEGDEESEQYFEEVTSMIHDLGLSQHVRLLGARTDVETVYNACDITLLPSLFEGTPNVALESLASGVPVIATDVADNRFLIPDDEVGFIVPLDEPDTFAERIEALLSDATRRECFSAAARQQIEAGFTVSIMVQNMAAVYNEFSPQNNQKT